MSQPTIFRLSLLAALAASLLFLAPVFGQEFRGTIAGTVTDPSGAVVPKAQLEARNADTSAVTTASTNDTPPQSLRPAPMTPESTPSRSCFPAPIRLREWPVVSRRP
ncbi:exported hypothetical protein [Candidatus Sulfopaludibacter sp. SbA3]|nr:exported hypothetical protein [Candidatus Sulfopaludibacter sp. SbA3]